jgi:hypothetical protein
MKTKELVMRSTNFASGTFAELLKKAATGSVIELDISRDLGIHVFTFPELTDHLMGDFNPGHTRRVHTTQEFFYRNQLNEEVSLGKHACNSHCGWSVGGEPLLFLLRITKEFVGIEKMSEGEFVRVEKNGTETSLGLHEIMMNSHGYWYEEFMSSSWWLGATGPVFMRSDRQVIMVLSDGTERNLGQHDRGDKLIEMKAGPYGVVINDGQRFFRVNINGEEIALPDTCPEFDYWGPAAYGLVLRNKSKGEYYYYVIK